MSGMPSGAPVDRWVTSASKTLAAQGLPLHDLREKDLSRALKDVINTDTPGCAKTLVLPLDEWPSLGRSTTDIVVVDGPRSRKPTSVLELKWCQAGQDKIHEAVWDLPRSLS